MIEIKCDNCGQDLSTPRGIENYRIKVCLEKIPTTECVVDVYIVPPLEDTLHFCGKGCMTKFLTNQNEKD